jgi:hypothetical protein
MGVIATVLSADTYAMQLCRQGLLGLRKHLRYFGMDLE